MKRKISLLLLIFMLVGTGSLYAYDVNLKPFPDVEQHDWAAESIYFLSALNIISGYPDRTFRPIDTVTREAFLKMLVETAKLDNLDAEIGAEKRPMPLDVSDTYWSYPYVLAAVHHHLLDFMIEEQSFYPGQDITREEVAVLVGKYLLSQQSEQFQEEWLNGGWQVELNLRPFLDQDKFNPELLPYLYFTVNQQIMEGNHLQQFNPKNSLIRKEASAIIYRLIGSLIADKSLDFVGFYAFNSYPYVDKLPLLTNVTLGWAEMEYSKLGHATISTTGEWKIPQGYEEVIQKADAAHLEKDLMVFYNKPNLSDFLKDNEAQNSFIDALLLMLDDPSFGFTGVFIDFEGTGLKGEENREDFILFLQKVKESIGTKNLTVAVPPTYYYHGYDLKSIGEVADYVLVMAYDFTHKESRLPSAPLPLVNDTLNHMLSLIPKEKVILGISKQANQWITTPASVDYYQPRPYLVEDRLKQPGVSHQLGYPYLLDQITFSDERGYHEIWYEGSNSIKYKIMLAKYYGIDRLAYWYMGNYSEADWKLVEDNR